MVFANNYNNINGLKYTRFPQKKSDTTEEGIKSFIADIDTPTGSKSGIIRTDDGGGFEGRFLRTAGPTMIAIIYE